MKAELEEIYGGLRGDLELAISEKNDVIQSTEIARLAVERDLVEKTVLCDSLMNIVHEKESADASWKEESVNANESLRGRLAALEEQNNGKEEEVKDLERRLQESVLRADGRLAQLESLAAAYAALETRAEEAEEKWRRSEETGDDLRRHVEGLVEERQVLGNRAKELEDAREQLRGEAEALTSDKQLLLDNEAALRQQNSELQALCDKRTTAEEAAKIELAQTRTSLEKKLEASNAEKKRVCDGLRNDFEQIILDKEDILSGLKAKLGEVRSERDKELGRLAREASADKEGYELKVKDMADMLEKVQLEKEQMFDRLMQDAQAGKDELSAGLTREFELLLTEKDESAQGLQSALDEAREKLARADKAREETSSALAAARVETSDLTGQRAELQQQLDEQSRRHADDVTRLKTRLEEITQAHEREQDKVARELAAREGDLAETADRLAAAEQVRRCSLVTRLPQVTWN